MAEGNELNLANVYFCFNWQPARKNNCWEAILAHTWVLKLCLGTKYYR